MYRPEGEAHYRLGICHKLLLSVDAVLPGAYEEMEEGNNGRELNT